MNTVLLAIFGVCLAVPAAAQERMTRTICQQSLERVSMLVDPDNPDLAGQIQQLRVTGDGWCRIRQSDQGFEDAPFTELDWRMEDSARWTDQGIPPLALHIRARGLDPDEMQNSNDTNRPDVSVDITLRQNPDAGLIVLERAVMDNAAGDIMSVSGVFERVFLSSPSMMQISMGSAAFKAGLVSLTLDGRYENPFGLNIDVDVQGTNQAQRGAAFDAISNLPKGVIDDASRAELTAYAGDLPRPVGTLEVSAASERGLGLMQIGMAMYSSFATIADDTAISNEMEILFDGLAITADWTPAAQVAD